MNPPPWPQGQGPYQRNLNSSYQVQRSEFYQHPQAHQQMIQPPMMRHQMSRTFHGVPSYHPDDEEGLARPIQDYRLVGD